VVFLLNYFYSVLVASVVVSVGRQRVLSCKWEQPRQRTHARLKKPSTP